MNNQTGIEIVWVTPAEIGGAFLLGLLLALVALGIGWWARGGVVDVEDEPDEDADAEFATHGAPAEVEAEPEVEADADPEETAEIRTRGRRRPLLPGTICAPGVTPPPDSTVVIDASAVRDAR